MVGVGEDGGGGSNGKKWERATVWGLAHHLKVEEVASAAPGRSAAALVAAGVVPVPLLPIR